MEQQKHEQPLSSSTPDALESLVQDLKRNLERPNVLTPDTKGYSDSIKRWSDGVEKRAVRAGFRTK